MSEELEEQYGIFDFQDEQKRGTDLLPEVFKNSVNIKKVINIFMSMIQDLHDSGKDVYSKINIFEAEGSQLDDIFGNFLEVTRELGESDDNYRARIISKTAQLARSGEILTMKNAYRALVNASTVSLYEFQSAAFKMEAAVSTLPSASFLATVRNELEKAKQGGNNMELTITDQIAFELGDHTTPQLNDPNGLSDSGFDGGFLSEGF